MMGALPNIFTGDCTKADQFIDALKDYIHLNRRVSGMNSHIHHVSLALTLIQGDQVAGWKRSIGNWVDTLQDTDDIPAVWAQFLHEFTTQYQDSQKEQRAKATLEQLKLKGLSIDQYISEFEDLAMQAGYALGKEETKSFFMKGLTRTIVEDVL